MIMQEEQKEEKFKMKFLATIGKKLTHNVNTLKVPSSNNLMSGKVNNVNRRSSANTPFDNGKYQQSRDENKDKRSIYKPRLSQLDAEDQH